MDKLRLALNQFPGDGCCDPVASFKTPGIASSTDPLTFMLRVPIPVAPEMSAAASRIIWSM